MNKLINSLIDYGWFLLPPGIVVGQLLFPAQQHWDAWLLAVGLVLTTGIFLNVRLGPHSEWGRRNRIRMLVESGTRFDDAVLTVYYRDAVERGMQLRPTERDLLDEVLLRADESDETKQGVSG